MKCPKCGKECEHGYLNTAGFPLPPFQGAFLANWSKQKYNYGFNGETIAWPEGGFGSFSLEGFRCKECRTLVLNY